MDAKLAAVFENLQERMEPEAKLYAELPREEVERRIDEFMLPIGADAGLFLSMLVKSAGFTSLLEVGTSVGYSTLWLAEAARENGGHLVTLDNNEKKLAEARENITRAGLVDRVTFIPGDALKSLKALTEPVDFVLLDVGRNLYVQCFDIFWPLIAPGGIIAADNIISPAATAELAKTYQQRVRAEPGVDSVLVPIGNGIELSRRPS